MEVVETVELSETTVEDLLGCKLVVFNDDDNSFEWVIECFCLYLSMGTEQAEQLAMNIHHTGKAVVKNGSREELEPYYTALKDAGLNVEIQ